MWEQIEEREENGNKLITERMKVENGWLVRSVILHEVKGYKQIEQNFIEDRFHVWEV